MAVTPGTRLGPYEIVAPLGAGGMGEVYRAKDTRLGRDVAVKVLPEHLVANPEVRARFEREAKTISSLNHPHICTLFDVGHEGETEYLVMELVEGETLAERVSRGPVPAAELLRLGVQIADALDRAHRAGIIHRDLKPANVMLTKSGAKLMDFGLARATGMTGTGGTSGVTVAALTQSPTVAQSLTTEGTLVGTFLYMAPEQLEGKEADARSDIWAFGCVLYEMATGKRAFEGRSQASLISSIMGSEPKAISQVAPMSPPGLDRLVARCLAKEADERWQTASDLKHELQWIVDGGSQAGVPAPLAARRRSRERLAWTFGIVSALAAVALAVLHFALRPPAPFALRFEIPAPRAVQFQDAPRISPDGRYLAYNATDSTGASRVWVRAMNSLAAQPLPGTEGATRPFWSPDSRFLGFIAGGKLKKIAVSGGPATAVCDAPTGSDGTWGRGGVILFDGRGADPIMRVAAGGGVATACVRPDTAHKIPQVGWPEFLPDGRHFLYLAIGPQSTLRVGDLNSKLVRDLGPCESQVQYVPPGYLLYSRGGSLVLQRFDSGALKFTGEPVPVADQVATDAIGGSDFRTSMNGTLVYSARRSQGGELVEVDRGGHELRKIPCPPTALHPALSPDGKRIAVRVFDEQVRSRDIWLVDPAREVTTRLTFDTSNENYPLWSPDGRRIALYSDNAQWSGLSVQNVAGLANRDLLVKSDDEIIPTDWSRDGKFIAYEAVGAQSKSDVWVVPVEGEHRAQPLLAGPYNENQPRFSPDGRLIAYASDESGRREVYVQTFPDLSDKWQVSTRGGSDPVWSPTGHELFYLSAEQQMMSVAVRPGPAFSMDLPRVLFAARILNPVGARNHYCVSGDGLRFYVLSPLDSRSLPPTTVIVNWMQELNRK